MLPVVLNAVAVAGALTSAPSESTVARVPLDYELAWNAPDDCPSAEAVRARIDALRPISGEGDGTLFIDASVSRAPDGAFRLELQTRFFSDVGARQIEASACEDLLETTATVVALSLVPSSERGSSAPDDRSRAQVPTPPPAAPRLEPAPLARRPQPHDRERPIGSTPAEASEPQRAGRSPLAAPEWSARVGGGLEYGAVGRPSALFTTAVGLAWPRASVAMHGFYVVPRLVSRSDPPVVADLGGGGVRACGRPTWGTLQFPLCAGFEAGVSTLRSRTTPFRSRARGPWLGPLGSASVVWRPRRVGLWATTEVVGRLVGTRGTSAGEEVFRPLAASARLLLGLEFGIS